MAAPQVPKYQAIYTNLRQRILDGEFAAGTRLPPQQELADQFGVTLMTLRQAVSSLESDGLVWAARGKGTFVADRPVDIRIGNLSSFAEQMQAAGVNMTTGILDIAVVPAADHPIAAAALGLGLDGELTRVTRLRSIDGLPISLQRSYLQPDIVKGNRPEDLVENSLYITIQTSTGWVVNEAIESITAISVSEIDAGHLHIESAQPALLSTRTSVNQFDQPFLYDEAILVSGRCAITADRTADRMTLNYGIAP